MTGREKAICEVFTGICFCVGAQRRYVYEYASELLGRPIYTHEFLTLATELKEKARADFVALCQAPTVDAVEVVRCRECEFWCADYCTRDIKGRTNMFYMPGAAFCSYGKRRAPDEGL